MYKQDPRRALHEAVAAAAGAAASSPPPSIANTPAAANSEPPQEEEDSHEQEHEHEQQQRQQQQRQQQQRQLERRDSRTLGGFLLTRRGPSIIRAGGQAEGRVARAYHLESVGREEGVEEEEGGGMG